MGAVNYSNFREYLKDYFKQVNDERFKNWTVIEW